MRAEELDRVAAFVSELKKQHKCVRFYQDYFKFYRNDGFYQEVSVRSASHLVTCGLMARSSFPARLSRSIAACLR